MRAKTKALGLRDAFLTHDMNQIFFYCWGRKAHLMCVIFTKNVVGSVS